jgi:antitoxin (DNA-binding transcriptional repressor) of toxin-antitoxin stability system
MEIKRQRSKVVQRNLGGDASRTSVSIRELRRDWRAIRAKVARGKKIVVTDNGVPIMQLVAIEKPAAANVDWLAHLETIREISAGKTTGGNAVLEERASAKW